MNDFNIDEMRQQMAILQNKLDNQTKVNLAGTWNMTAGDFSVTARNNEKFD